MYELNEDIVRRVYIILNSNNYFNISSGYNIDIQFQLADKYSNKIKRPTDKDRILILKYPKINRVKGFYMMLDNYLKLEYDFDLGDYSRKNKIDILKTYVLFSLLHEYGHMIEYIKRLNLQGDYTQTEELIIMNSYYNVSKIEDINIRFNHYRRIESEANADKMAMELMKKFKKEFKIIFRS